MKIHPLKKEKKNQILSTKLPSIPKLILFRSLVFISLFITVSLCGFLAYWILYSQEDESFKAHYDSISTQLHHSALERLKRAQEAGNELAAVHSIYHPKASSWPFAFLRGYDNIHDHISKVANLNVVGMAPIVKPEEVESFENYMRDIYQKDPFNLTTPNLDLGIFGINENGIYHDTTGESPYSDKNLITPILNVGNIKWSASALNFNLHSEKNRGESIDASYDCALKTKGPCSSMTDIIQLVNSASEVAEPNSLIIRAIYPFDDPDTLVGFQIVSISWEVLFKGLVPDFVCGLDAVLSTDTQQFTYAFCDGDVSLKCVGDCHSSDFDSEVHFATLEEKNLELIQSSHYSLAAYPSKEFRDKYYSNTPWISSIVIVFIILVTSCVFVSYDYLVKKDSNAKEQILEAKRRFVRFVSHEIRSPLNTLVLGLKLLLENINLQVTELSVRMKLVELASELKGSCDVAVMVLNDLLHYDKIETGNLNLDMKPTRIWKLIHRTTNLFRGSARENRVTLIDDLAGLTGAEKLSHLGVSGDLLRLSQVISNIISNALKFSPAGSTVQIKSEYRKESHFPKLKRNNKGGNTTQNKKYEADEWIIFSVKDQGPGISAQNLKKLFGEGVQFNPNELQRGQGSGLGLWISKGIIELHGGRIWATSEGEGKGCTFFFQLPLIELTEESMLSSEDSFHTSVNIRNNATSPLGIRMERSSLTDASVKTVDTLRSTKHKTERSNSPLKFMIVDDVALCRKMLARSLEAKGFECVEAGNGEECIGILEGGEEVDCILMDFQMPVLNGPDATKKLREKGFLMPVVGVTGNVMSEDVKEFMDGGADLVMQKPFQMEVFDRFVKDNLM